MYWRCMGCVCLQHGAYMGSEHVVGTIKCRLWGPADVSTQEPSLGRLPGQTLFPGLRQSSRGACTWIARVRYSTNTSLCFQLVVTLNVTALRLLQKWKLLAGACTTTHLSTVIDKSLQTTAHACISVFCLSHTLVPLTMFTHLLKHKRIVQDLFHWGILTTTMHVWHRNSGWCFIEIPGMYVARVNAQQIHVHRYRVICTANALPWLCACA